MLTWRYLRWGWWGWTWGWVRWDWSNSRDFTSWRSDYETGWGSSKRRASLVPQFLVSCSSASLKPLAWWVRWYFLSWWADFLQLAVLLRMAGPGSKFPWRGCRVGRDRVGAAAILGFIFCQFCCAGRSASSASPLPPAAEHGLATNHPNSASRRSCPSLLVFDSKPTHSGSEEATKI